MLFLTLPTVLVVLVIDLIIPLFIQNKCSYCKINIIFDFKQTFLFHTRSVSRFSDLFAFRCELCSRVFSSEQVLNIHVLGVHGSITATIDSPDFEIRYSTVQCSTVQYSTVQYSTVQYSTVQYSTVKYSTV